MQPSSICQCEIGETLNPFNLSQTNQSEANVSLIFPPPFDAMFGSNPVSLINC